MALEDSIAAAIERTVQAIKEKAATLRAEYRAKRLAQQKKKHRNEKTRQQYKKKKTLQQATPSTLEQITQPATQQKQKSEKSAEKATASSSSTVNTSLLPAAPHQAAKQLSREPASHSSGIRLIFYGCKAAKHYHDALLASPLGYMEYAKDMEATGEG